MGTSKDKIRHMVKESYARVVQSDACRCCGDSSNLVNILDLGKKLDYTDDELAIGLGEANLGLGCGNPLTIADLKPGETVLDLGSGAGFDAFLAAKSVGKEGKVIGVDMTPEMIKKDNSEQIIKSWNLGEGTEHMVFSAYIRARKP